MCALLFRCVICVADVACGATTAPGAAFIDWTKDIVDTEDPVPVQLAGADAFAAAMEERGVGNDKTVVVYDGGKMLFATRLWWALTLYGHPDVSASQRHQDRILCDVRCAMYECDQLTDGVRLRCAFWTAGGRGGLRRGGTRTGMRGVR